MHTTEQIYKLVKQWCSARDQSRDSEAFRQIAIITGCIPYGSDPLTDKQHRCVLQWLQENHLNVYLWATGELYIGHPATVWGYVGC